MNEITSTPLRGADSAVDRFLEAVRCGTAAAAQDVHSDSIVLDATVPGWRFLLRGRAAVCAEYGRWFAAPAAFTELHRQPTPSGEVVEYFLSWVEDGVVHGAHHAHVLTVDAASDRITEDHVFCGGRWPAPLLAEMNAPAFETAG